MDKQNLYPVLQLDGAQGSEIELPAAGTGDENIRIVTLQSGIVARFHASFLSVSFGAIDKTAEPDGRGRQGRRPCGSEQSPRPQPLVYPGGGGRKKGDCPDSRA